MRTHIKNIVLISILSLFSSTFVLAQDAANPNAANFNPNANATNQEIVTTELKETQNNQASSDTKVLISGTTIPVKLSQNINANMDITGKSIYFTVTEDIFVGDNLVIRSGEFVNGFVTDAVGRKSLGKGGKLTITPKSLKTQNNQIVKFEQNPLSSEGRKRTGATVAHVVMWGPLGLFAKGRAAYILRDTEFDLVVENDVNLKPYNQLKRTISQRNSIEAIFKEYSSKINYRKGKIGKDFVLYISSNQKTNKSLKRKDISIYSVNDEVLPKSIKAKSMIFNARKNRYEVVFDFTQVISYIYPGLVEIVVNIGDSLKAEVSLSTKWKMK